MAQERLDNLRNINESLDKQLKDISGINSANERRAIITQQISNYESVIRDLTNETLKGKKDHTKQIEELSRKQKKLIDDEEKINKKIKRQNDLRKGSVDIARDLAAQLKVGWKYLQDQDKIIKSVNLNLGLSGSKAVAMRNAFESSADFVTRIGGSLEDVSGVMQGFADETGRARALSASMVNDIISIGRGTGLGVESAAQLGAQFELMGIDTRATLNHVQGVVDTSERMGVNTTKVMKNITTNFKKLNTYTFQQGVKGFGDMATYAEKFKIDMTDVLGAADIGRNLETAVDLAAQLQIMGGEFAKNDPFEILFLSRNDPAKLTEKIADMTKGIVSFRKMSDGTFEKFISPADRDRLAGVAKSLGMEASALTEIAQRQADIQKMRQQMAGLGLSKEQKELIEGAAIFDSKSGKFQVQVAGTLKSIGTLTQQQAESFSTQQVLLKERAKDALTFNEVFAATLNNLKSTLIPLLKQVNGVLEWLKPTLTSIMDIAKSIGPWATGAGLLAAAAAWKGVGNMLTNFASRTVQNGGGRGLSSMAGRYTHTATRMPNKNILPTGGVSMGDGQGALAAGKGAGMKSLGKGAGVGLAGAGVGAGIMLAAKGIGTLAQSIKDVDVEKLWAMNVSVIAIGATMAGILVPAISAVGAAGTAGSLGLLALGATAVGIGFGINLAAKGIGYMAEGLGNMVDKSKGGGKDLLMVAGGIAGIAGSLALLGNPLTTVGLATFAGVMGVITVASLATAKVTGNIAKMGIAMSGTKDDWIAIENAVNSISNANTKGGGVIADLANLMKKPLVVKFAKDATIKMVNDITLEIDGKRFMHHAYDAKIAAQMTDRLRTGIA